MKLRETSQKTISYLFGQVNAMGFGGKCLDLIIGIPFSKENALKLFDVITLVGCLVMLILKNRKLINKVK